MSDRRFSPESIKAQQILVPVLSAQHPFTMEFVIEEELDVNKVMQNVRNRMRSKGVAEEYSLTTRPRQLFISTRRPRKETAERRMIRKLAMHVDNERLYEEAMALVGTI